MEPVSPVVPGAEPIETVYAADQPEYRPLPVFRTSRSVLSRWRLTDEEREHIANGGDLFICQMNFGCDLQPIMPMAVAPEVALEAQLEQEG